ncbi:unnamed protein product [Anisakis simplex]|uniref:PDZ domain-containing protein n=1 Tax=Anisakis simplex TaxID=6269 RepID=A0A0M3JZ69_ANISI|nr:unnamed protein product [Anisakis simplex]
MPEDSTEGSEEEVSTQPPTYKFGVKLGKDLMVEGVKKEMRADGFLQLGDVLISVNDIKIEDDEHFFKLINRLFPQVRIELERKVQISPLSEQRARLIGLTPKRNCEYFIAHVYRIPGIKLGMSIKQSHNTVIVTKCESDGLTSKRYEEGDRIVDVDGHRVYTKDDAKERILNGLRFSSHISTVVERRICGDNQNSSMAQFEMIAFFSMRALLTSSAGREPKMAQDAITIGQQEMARIRARAGQAFPIRSILRRDKCINSSANALQFNPKPLVMRVACDTKEADHLIHVRRRDSKRGFLSFIFGKHARK